MSKINRAGPSFGGAGFSQFRAGTRFSPKALTSRIVVTEPFLIARNNYFEKGRIAVPETVALSQLLLWCEIVWLSFSEFG